MEKSKSKSNLNVKFAIYNSILVISILTTLTGIVSYSVSTTLNQKVSTQTEQGKNMVMEMIKSNDQDLRKRTTFLANSLSNHLSGSKELQTTTVDGKIENTLLINGQKVNGNTKIMDDFTTSTGAVATIFMRQGEDFLRVTTSLKKENGERAVGTTLDKAHPAYSKLLANQSYQGPATLFGKKYMTNYLPINDSKGNVIGVEFIGLEFSESLSALQNSIQSFTINKTGKYFIVDTSSKTQGELVVHHNAKGSNILTLKDVKGTEVIKDMIAKKDGSFTSEWNSSPNESPSERLSYFSAYDPWNWLVVAEAPTIDAKEEINKILTILGALGVASLFLFCIFGYFLINKMFILPIKNMVQKAHQIAKGNLTERVENIRNDEVGELQSSINSISENLLTLVQEVNVKAHQVANASNEIAQGNNNLSVRTENNAAAIEETAAAMVELENTISQNADNSRGAEKLAKQTQQIVQDGNVSVQKIVKTMKDIESSSSKISDITNIIDSIAFQTNLLALNAAVEAARAGEQGRGFAVVAGEVRSLARKSAEAAKDIKNLIQSSNQEINKGSGMVVEAGKTMTKAVSQIQEVTEYITQISIASSEQSKGVRETSAAITNLEQGVQQNVALVEEMAGAAESLHDQSEELLKAIAAFRY